MDNKEENLYSNASSAYGTQNQTQPINNNNLEYNFNFESQVNSNNNVNNNPSSTAFSFFNSSVSDEKPEVLGFEEDTNQNTLNQEKLKSLNNDTNNFVNPSMVVSPQLNKQEKVETLDIEEPKVDYEKITEKKNYMFMFILFAVIIVFIIFLPKIVELIGL